MSETAQSTEQSTEQSGGEAVAGAVVAVATEAEAEAGGLQVPRFEGVVEFHGILTRDPSLKRVIEIARNVARSEASVLIRGESGTGKELFARALHDESGRAAGPFLAINCAALTPSLLESELFGHKRGAFTGAVRDYPGLFKQADGGTLFLDEIAELPLELQAKLLRAIETRKFTPVGCVKSVSVDVRIVAATHRSLREMAARGAFREDLMFRLRVVPIFIPPLRERRADVELLLWHFIAKGNLRRARTIARIEPRAMKGLLDYPWPGNVRELQNVVEYAFAVGHGAALSCDDLPPEFGERRRALEAAGAVERGAVAAMGAGIGTGAKPGGGVGAAMGGATGGAMGAGVGVETGARGWRDDVEAHEREKLRAALVAAGGHLGEAAKALGVSRATLWRKRQKLGLVD